MYLQGFNVCLRPNLRCDDQNDLLMPVNDIITIGRQPKYRNFIPNNYNNRQHLLPNYLSNNGQIDQF